MKGAGAVAVGAVLGVGIAFFAGGAGDDTPSAVSLPYPASREASSELEPGRTAEMSEPAPAPVVTAALTPPPKPRAKGEALPAWRKNAARVVLAPDWPRIAVVIDDLGLDRKRSARATALPAPVTLAFLPYASALEAQTRHARARGHELLVHVPMEPFAGAGDPGPEVLRVSQARDEIRARLETALARFHGYVGINNHMGSRFTSDRGAMDIVMGVLKVHGLLFLDSRTTKTTVAFDRAMANGVPATFRQVFLDRDLDPAAVDGELRRLEHLARAHGQAVAIGHPHDVTLAALERWLPTLKARRFQLAPVSAIVHAPARVLTVGR